MKSCRVTTSGDVGRFVPDVNIGFWKGLTDPVTANGYGDMTRAEGNNGVLCKQGNRCCGCTRGSVNMVMDLLAQKEPF
jgi:hypothetical protein